LAVGSLCILTSFILLLGISKKARWLLVPHLLWQISYASICFLLTLLMLRLGWRGIMIWPSSIVLTVLLSVPDEPSDFSSIAFPAYRQVPVTERIAQGLCGEETGTRNSTNGSTYRSSTDL
ncbi:hypothetical protein PMAYCL1PPCAC_28466, partial [Pristionchus mayeri]